MTWINIYMYSKYCTESEQLIHNFIRLHKTLWQWLLLYQRFVNSSEKCAAYIIGAWLGIATLKKNSISLMICTCLNTFHLWTFDSVIISLLTGTMPLCEIQLFLQGLKRTSFKAPSKALLNCYSGRARICISSMARTEKRRT